MSIRTALREYGFSKYALKEAAVGSASARRVFDAFACARARMYRAAGRTYDQAHVVCQAVRLMEDHARSRDLNNFHAEVLRNAGVGTGANAIRDSYLQSPQSRAAALEYLCHGPDLAARMKFPRSPDDVRRQGNLVVLKAHDAVRGEKGVLYLQYTESIRAFVALFDIERIAKNYRLVVEPSSWGYQDESFLLLVHGAFDVLVQSQDPVDYKYIEGLRSNLIPLPFGAGDWIDADSFAPSAEPKTFDFVMVASWSPVKRHALFFDALAAAGLHHAPVALVGYAWEGCTRQHIEKLAARAGLTNVSIFERIPRAEVAAVIRRSRVGVMLTRREGANRGIYECLFCDVPVVVSASNRGVNKSMINERTGRLVSDENLPAALRGMLENTSDFRPREWMELHTGYRNAGRALDAAIATLAQSRGESYSTPIAGIRSSPAAAYVDEGERTALDAEYANLRLLLRRN
jgi:glycosyltransferase involved in cell wall biosynthesis